MGQTLSEPVTNKETSSVEDSRVKVGASSMQGWRISMEDAHTHLLRLPEDNDAMFFGVFDGHGGAKVADFSSKHLPRYICKQAEYEEGRYEAAIVKGFLELDQLMRTEECLKDESSGATAITTLIRGDTLYCGNAGDSRAIACVGGVAVPLSTDHKPDDDAERERIENAGGFVEFKRVNGNLALSRALGDFAFKNSPDLPAEQQIVTACPDVVVKKITGEWDFVVLACDGIWDVLQNQEVSDFVLRRIGQGLEPDAISEALMTRCLAADCSLGGVGCDNMTVVILVFLHGKKYSEVVSKCSDLIKKRDAEKDAEASDADSDGSDRPHSDEEDLSEARQRTCESKEEEEKGAEEAMGEVNGDASE